MNNFKEELHPQRKSKKQKLRTVFNRENYGIYELTLRYNKTLLAAGEGTAEMTQCCSRNEQQLCDSSSQQNTPRERTNIGAGRARSDALLFLVPWKRPVAHNFYNAVCWDSNYCAYPPAMSVERVYENESHFAHDTIE